MSDPRYVTVRQLQLLVAVANALHDVLGVALLANWERCGDDRFRFGVEEDVPGTPYVELVHIDWFGGDDWSGSLRDDDTFTVRGLRHDDGRAVYLVFQSVESSLAGRCFDVYSSLPEPTRQALDIAWRDARARRAELTIPVEWTWLLTPNDRATLP